MVLWHRGSVWFVLRFLPSLPPVVWHLWSHGTSSPLRVSVPLLRMLDQMLAHGCFDVLTAEEE